MSASKLRIETISPGDPKLADAIRSMGRTGGYVTCFAQSRLVTLRADIGEDSEVEGIEFGRLLTLVCRSMGLPTGSLENANQTLAGIDVACRHLPPDSQLSSVRKFRGFHRRLQGVLDEFLRLGWTNEDLLFAADRVGGEFSEKLRDIALIAQEIAAFSERFGYEETNDLVRRMEAATASNECPIKHLVVVASGERRPGWCRWLQWLAARGVDIRVFLEADSTGQFPDAKDMARDLGLDELPRPTAAWWDGLFTEFDKNLHHPQIKTLSTGDPLAECEWVMRECARYRTQQNSYSNITIFVRDIEQYAPLLEASAARFGVHLDMRRQAKIDSNGLAQFALLVLGVAASSDVRDIGRLAQSSYLPLTSEQRTSIAHITSEAFRYPETAWDTMMQWQRTHPEHAWLGILLSWRPRNLKLINSYGVWRALTLDLIGKIGPPPPSHAALRERDMRAKKAMERSLMDAALPYDASELPGMSLQTFVDQCAEVWAEDSYVTPGHVGGVRVVSRAEALGNSDVIFCMGVVEGRFPRRRTENPILDDEERRILSESMPDLPALEDSFLIAERERELLLRVCASAKSNLIFSFPRSSEDRMTVPAYYLKQLESALGEELKSESHKLEELAPEDGNLIADLELRDALELPRDPVLSAPFISDTNLKSQIFQRAQVATRPRDLSRSFACGFWGGATGPLALKPEHLQQVAWVALSTLPRRAKLAAQPSPEVALQALNGALEVLIGDSFPYLSEAELTLLEETGKRLIAGWIEREFLSRELWNRDESTVRLETKIQNADFFLSAIPVSKDSKIELQATIPATYVSRGHHILLFYRDSDPGLKFDSGPVIDEREFELKLFYSLMSGKTDYMGIEIDAMRGVRSLYYLSKGNTNFRQKVETGMRAVRLRGSEETDEADKLIYLGEVNKQVREAAKKIAESSLLAEPGPYCSRCDYGELCRVHHEWGERIDLFQMLEESDQT